jgi:hypothetical protein
LNVAGQFIAAACLIGLAGCGGGVKADEREAYWASELGEFFVNERNLSELHPWLREHDVYYTIQESDIVDGE